MSADKKKMKIALLGQAFYPSAPIKMSSLFAGRIELVNDVIWGLTQPGQHIILYGEMGVGKTSFANIIKESLDHVATVVKVNCDSQDKYMSIWQKVLREIVLVTNSKGVGFVQPDKKENISLDRFIQGKEEIHPEDIRYILDFYPKPLIIIIDDVEKIKDKQITTSLIADTIKTLSDHSSISRLILVGVADSVDGLIAEHKSVDRNLVQVPLPRMSLLELQEILEKGYRILNITINDGAKKRIVRLSQGLPHYTHLLGLYSAEVAIVNDRSEIDESDVETAIKRAIKKTQRTIISAYNRAVNSPRKTLFSQVLLSCALAKKDELGTFAASDVRRPMTLIMNHNYEIPAFARHLNDFCESKRGSILEKQGSPRRFRYRFANPMLEPYTILRGLATEIIDYEKLDKIAG